MATIIELLDWAKEALAAHESPLMEAQMLLAHVLQCERAAFYTWPEKSVEIDREEIFKKLVARRLANEPMAYILEQREFWSLPFRVTPSTLIPRHDTELLVETVLSLLPENSLNIVDIGTGCGPIACALAHARPNWHVCATDISIEALDIAKHNAKTLNLVNVDFIQSDWLTELVGQQFDAIVGNPPYIRAGDVHLIHGDLFFEPAIALSPGPSGLEAFEIILRQVPTVLKPGGLVAFEHGFDQGAKLGLMLAQAGYKQIKTYVDHAGNERVTAAWMPS